MWSAQGIRQEMYRRRSPTSLTRCCRRSLGFAAASGDYQQVLYADYQTGTQAPACHITGCTHDSPSCPACFFTGVPVTLPCPVGNGTYLSFVYGYDSDGMSIVRLNQDYGVEQVLYHCNYISSFYCYTDGSSLWFSTCPSGDSYDRIKRLDLSTGGITTLFDAGDTSGQSANIIGCTGRQLVVSVSPYYDSSEPQTSCLYLVDADTGAAELLREYPITNASAGRTTNISTAVLDDTLYEYDYTTGELTATALHTVFDCHTEIDETENDEDAAEKGDASGNLSHDLREHTLNSFL